MKNKLDEYEAANIQLKERVLQAEAYNKRFGTEDDEEILKIKKEHKKKLCNF